MAKSGFAAVTTDEETPVVTESTIPLNDLKFDDVELCDLGNKLPVGIYLKEERLTDFILKPFSGTDEVDLGKMVEANSDRDGNLKEPATVLKGFLPKVIESIGGYSIPDLAKQLQTSPQRLFEDMYLADSITLILSIRLQAQGWEIAMSGKCPECGTIATDNPDKGRLYHDLSSLEVRLIPSRFSQKPIIELTLPEPWLLYEDTITKLWLEPMKLRQLDKLLKSNSGNPKDMDQVFEMVVGIPESTDYANKKGRLFDPALYADFCTGTNGKISPNKQALYDAIAKIVPGPKMEAEMDCGNSRCRNHWTQYIPWISFREFLYFTPSAPKE